MFSVGRLAFERMVKHRQDAKRKKEAGGLLVGRHLLNRVDIVVDGITEPLPGDRRTRFTFFRAPEKHQSALDLAWQVSEGTETYLGEWHTHPEEVPTPSTTDLRNWKRKLRLDVYSDVLFFVIVGTHAVVVWEGAATGKLNQLDAIQHLSE